MVNYARAMPSGFRVLFDLTAQPGRIQPAYWFYAIFIAAGVFLAILAFLAVRFQSRRRYVLVPFAAFWIVFCTYMVITDSSDVAAVRRAVELGAYEKVEGCLAYFRPGSPYGTKTTAGNEQWSVAGQVFSYGKGEVRPGYHLVSTAGGQMQADARVRVWSVPSPQYSRREIVRLEVAPHACPTARRVEPFAEP